MDNIDKNIEQEQEIDFIEQAKKLWNNRKFILKVCGIGLLIGVIVAFSLPKEYTTTIILSPEGNNAQSGGLGALAAIAGINLQQNTGTDLSPDLYPNIITSTPFLMGMFEVQVKDPKENINTSLYAYLNEKQKNAWWSYILNAPLNLLALFSSKEKGIIGQDARMIVLSKEQTKILKNLNNRINVSVDKKTGIITLSSKMQSAVISAFIADTVTAYMQSYIISYRTQKARQDLAFTENLYSNAKDNYYKAQQNLSAYMDENLGIVSARYKTTLDRLQNEANLAFGVYNQTAQQLQIAKMKVQDTTPVYTVIQPAVVPLKASLSKLIVLIAFLFLAGIGSCGWVLVRDSLQITNKVCQKLKNQN